MRQACILLLAILTGCSSDFLPFSSGALDGTVTAVPENWDSVAAIEVIQLETNPVEPYSVNLWVAEVNDSLYVHAGANRAAWVENIEADPAVRLKVGDVIYELEAIRVEDQAEFDAFGDQWEEKYGNQPRNGNVTEAYLYRLEPRG